MLCSIFTFCFTTMLQAANDVQLTSFFTTTNTVFVGVTWC